MAQTPASFSPGSHQPAGKGPDQRHWSSQPRCDSFTLQPVSGHVSDPIMKPQNQGFTDRGSRSPRNL